MKSPEEILGPAIVDHISGDLDSLRTGLPYFNWTYNEDTIILDGEFSLELLQAIITWVNEAKSDSPDPE